MNRVESTLDAIIVQLDANNFRIWNPTEVKLLISLIETYYTRVGRSCNRDLTALFMSPRESSKHVELCDHSELSYACGFAKLNRCNTIAEAENTQEHDNQNATSTMMEEDLLFQASSSSMCFPSEEQVAEVDRNLTRIRYYLQKKCPWGSLNEPSYSPYNTYDRCTPVLKDLHGVKCIETHKKIPRSCDEASEECCSHGKKGSDVNNEVVPSFSLLESGPARLPATLVPPPVCVVDAFLYNTDDIEALVAERQLCREYCRRCGSIDIGLVDFITHSFSQDQLVYLSCFLVPMLVAKATSRSCLTVKAAAGHQGDGEPRRGPPLSPSSQPQTQEPHGDDRIRRVESVSLVDVGSRLGVVLWSMYFAAKAGVYDVNSVTSGDSAGRVLLKRVLGVERDPHFVLMQRELGRRYCAQPFLFLDILESDCFEGEGAAALESSDFIVLHNVFEYFSESPEKHLCCWMKLRGLVRRPGQILICSPSLQETFGSFDQIDENYLSEVLTSELSTSDTLQAGKGSKKKNRTQPSNLEGKGEKPSKRLREDVSDVKKSLNITRDVKANRKWQKEWIDSYVESVNVDAIVKCFLRLRMESQTIFHNAGSFDEEKSPESPLKRHALHHGSEEYRDYSKQLDDVHSSLDSIQLELEDQVRNIFVYRVK
ncbi:unnamed protein product [Phytomonas sp. EM1]|nr:unnamed protein product [Phytomonas sp. EM1]|eukprot:CCW64680.1 unnamed protein product [Phytomonas sp. isolate EM1]